MQWFMVENDPLTRQEDEKRRVEQTSQKNLMNRGQLIE